MPSERPLVSMIICTFNRNLETIKRLVDSIRIQDYPINRIELILVDQSTNPDIHSSNRKLCMDDGIRYEEYPSSPSLTSSRNHGIRLSKGDIILFLDDDVELIGKEYLNRIVGVFENDPKVVGVSGFGYYSDDKTEKGNASLRTRKKINHFLFTLDPRNNHIVTGYFYNISFYQKPAQLTEVDWLFGFNMAYRRQLFDKIQFDENLKKYSLREDVDFSYRAKSFGKICISPDACVWHFEDAGGRIDIRKRIIMELVYWAYLYWKDIRDPHTYVVVPVSLFILLRCLKMALFVGSFSDVVWTLGFYPQFLSSMDKIKRQDISGFNKLI